MACYNPIRAFTIEGAKTDTGHKAIFFREPLVPIKGLQEIQIPCGSCIGCRMDYSRSWMGRITKEATLYQNNCFLTLTYNNENLPTKDTINKETGELITGHPLVKKHVQDFIKRLRRQYEYHFGHKGIRFYACGEYGGRTGRPHYHLAMFNIDTTVFGDIKLIGNNKQGDALFTSKTIERIWGKGFITIGDLTPQSAAYIARYMLKKQKGKGKEWYYESKGIVSEYTSMSNKPGISRVWYEEHKDEYWISDKLYIPQKNKTPQEVKTPTYFDKLLEKEKGIEALEEVKQRRQARAKAQKALKMANTSLSESEQLKVEEARKKAQTDKLIRPLD